MVTWECRVTVSRNWVHRAIRWEANQARSLLICSAIFSGLLSICRGKRVSVKDLALPFRTFTGCSSLLSFASCDVTMWYCSVYLILYNVELGYPVPLSVGVKGGSNEKNKLLGSSHLEINIPSPQSHARYPVTIPGLCLPPSCIF